MRLRDLSHMCNVSAMGNQEVLLTTREAAELLGVAPQTIARWVESGRLVPTLRAPGLRGAMFFERAAVDALNLP